MTPPDYEKGPCASELLKYYVELGAGLDTMIEPLNRVDQTRIKTFLEIGCGYGFSLDFARFAFGWTVKGMDPSPLAAAGRDTLGLDIDSTYLSKETDFGKRFDLVMCSEVIEHLPVPAELITLIARTLADDGALILTTPNVLALRKDASASVLLSILAPGFHLVLYSPKSLEMLLKQSGFSYVRVWEQANSLHAIAAHRPYPTSPATKVDRAVYRRYLNARIADVQTDSTLAIGLIYRLFKEMANAGEFHEAERVFKDLKDTYYRVYGIDVDMPATLTFDGEADLSLSEFLRHYPFNLCCTLYFKGMCEFANRQDYPRAIEYFRAAVRAGVAISNKLSSPVFIVDSETENLVIQAAILTIYGLVNLDAAASVREFMVLCEHLPRTVPALVYGR